MAVEMPGYQQDVALYIFIISSETRVHFRTFQCCRRVGMFAIFQLTDLTSKQ